MPDGKTDVRAGKSMAAHGLYAMGQLGGIGFEEFAPRGGAEKQFLDLHGGAVGARYRPEFAGAAVQQKSVVQAASP